MDAKFTVGKIHITPDDYLVHFDERFGGKKSYINYYIAAYGLHQDNEISDTVYEDPADMGYHQHTIGVETFMVDAGSVEIIIRGKKAVATKGDIIQITPGTPHTFVWLEPNTIWREHFMQTQMPYDMLSQVRQRYYHPDTYDLATDGQGTEAIWFDFKPVAVSVPKEQMPEIRPYESGLQVFNFGGIELRQKVGRWELKNVKEIWQYVLQPGFEISWNEFNPNPVLLIVEEGELDCRIDGMEPFVAHTRDILHVPNHLAGEIKARGKVVLFDYNMVGYGLNAAEELLSIKVNEPEKFAESVEPVLAKHKVFLRGKKN